MRGFKEDFRTDVHCNEALNNVSCNFSVIDKCKMNKIELLISYVLIIIFYKHLSPVSMSYFIWLYIVIHYVKITACLHYGC